MTNVGIRLQSAKLGEIAAALLAAGYVDLEDRKSVV